MKLTKDGEKSLPQKILRRIWRRGRGSVFTADDFADMGERAFIDIALSRLAKKGKIRRIARGLYDYPVVHPELGAMSPSLESIAKALAGSEKIRLQPSGAYAASLLGLSEQVPMKIIFLTDGPSRKIVIDNREIILKRTTPKNMVAAGRLGGIIIQALRYLGKDAITPAMQARLVAAIPPDQRENVLKDVLSAPIWIRSLVTSLLLKEPLSDD
ncbi:MAG: type IV toxin-antitoxin system AbiEi family antitoxin domain-containing protein [Rectinema sp.]|nr:type IV toxin-antitoxin system AbiEi family antitoxin domain-containing protein [Rectinema sp.]